MTEPEWAELVAEPKTPPTEWITAGLDAVASLAVPVGVAWGLWPWLGPFAIAVGGVLLFLIVFLAAVLREPHPDVPEPLAEVAPLPGPADRGRVHVSGG